MLRAGWVPKVKGEEYGSQIYYSPLKLREMVEQADAQTEVREGFYAFAARPGVAKRNTLEDADAEDDD